MVKRLDGCFVGGVDKPDAAQWVALLAAAKGTSSNDKARMSGQERKMGRHVLLAFGQPLRLVRIHILELDNKQHQRLPSLA